MSEFSSLIHELEDAIAHGGAAKRQRALTLVTDLFVAGSCRYSSEQVAVFDDVIVTLAAAIETKARARLSRRLATLRNAPVKVVRSLAFDDAAEVAAPVLRQSDQLSEADLIANARSKSQGHLHAIAQRETLSADVTDILVARGDRRVVHAVSKNHGAAFSDSGFGALVERARGDDLLAGYIGMRRDVPRPHFLRLLESASASVRARLAAAHPGLVEEVRDAVADVASDISLQVRNASREHVRAKARIKRLCNTSQFSEGDLHAFACAQNFEHTAVALSALGRFPIDLVERALLDPGPDMVLILAKAARCCWSTTKTLLRMTAAGRKLSPMDLDQAMRHFERLQVRTAERAIEFYKARRGREDAVSPGADFRSSKAAAAMIMPGWQ
jgi:uncharacterized protein (DUF2336 family)